MTPRRSPPVRPHRALRPSFLASPGVAAAAIASWSSRSDTLRRLECMLDGGERDAVPAHRRRVEVAEEGVRAVEAVDAGHGVSRLYRR